MYVYEERIDQQRHQGTRKKIIGDLVNWRIQIKKSMEEEASHLENRMLYCLFACFLSLILVLHHTCTRNSFAPTPESEEITEEKPERKRCKSCAKENRCTRPQE
jgi:DNA polymerase elongation subunit (family B)